MDDIVNSNIFLIFELSSSGEEGEGKGGEGNVYMFEESVRGDEG